MSYFIALIIILVSSHYLIKRHFAQQQKANNFIISGINYYGYCCMIYIILAAILLLFILSYFNNFAIQHFFILLLVFTLALNLFFYKKISINFNARKHFEKCFLILLKVISIISIAITFLIVLSILVEAIKFFQAVSLHKFLFGTSWSPQIDIHSGQSGKEGVFGALPVFLGTFLIMIIAITVAVPFGIFSAIYLTEYANVKFRAIAKPILEILAGVPTVVYGYFAAFTVAPLLQSLFANFNIDIEAESALAAGLVMGIMIIPFILSLSDDVMNAVPKSLRDSSFALGATKSETIIRVVIPAAIPGISGAVLLAISRAIGETMIVAMAAGLNAKMTINPLESVTTATVQMVTLLVGDQEFDSPKTLAAFALGITLFVITLTLNLIALIIVKKYREKYD